MVRVSESTINYVIQPLAFLAAGYLAGRNIRYFPKASKGGLAYTALWGSGFAFVSQLGRGPESTPEDRLERMTIGLILATLSFPMIAQPWKGKATFSLTSAARLGIIEWMIGGSLTLLLPKRISKDYTKEHAVYEKDLAAWQTLTKDKRTDLFKHFYDADLPPLSLKEASIDWNRAFINTFPDFSTLTANQLGWWVEISIHVDSFSYYPSGPSSQKKTAVFIPSEIETQLNKSLHSYFMQHPVKFANRPLYENWPTKFQGKPPIPKVQDHLNAANFEQFQKLSREDLIFLCDEHKMASSGEDSVFNFEALPLPQQIAFNAAAFALSPAPLEGLLTYPIGEITQESVTLVTAEKRATEWIHAEFAKSISSYTLIDPGLRQQLDTHFSQKGLSSLNPEVQLKSLIVDAIQIDKTAATHWHRYFKENPKVWKDLEAARIYAFVELFCDRHMPVLPLEGTQLDPSESIFILSEDGGEETFSPNQSAWIQALNKYALSATPDGLS